jgi:hypothetical protein
MSSSTVIRGQTFGSLELATACAALVILLGLAVSLARYVRSADSQAAFVEQLTVLNGTLVRRGVPPELAYFAEDLAEGEARNPAEVHESAMRNAESWANFLGVAPAARFDPWGMPVVLIDGPHPLLGMAPHLRAFFMSAGPDGRYFTLADNVYGYDIAPGARVQATQPTPMATTRTGHGE